MKVLYNFLSVFEENKIKKNPNKTKPKNPRKLWSIFSCLVHITVIIVLFSGLLHAASPKIPLLLTEHCSGLSAREVQAQGCICNPNSPWSYLHLPCHSLFFPLKPVSVNAVKWWSSLTEQLLETLCSLLFNAQPQAWAIVLSLSSLGFPLCPLMTAK